MILKITQLIKSVLIVAMLSLGACAGMGDVVDTNAGVGPVNKQ